MTDNISIIGIDYPLQLRGIKAAIADNQAYAKALQDAQAFKGEARSKALASADKIQGRIESRAARLIGAKLNRGKIGVTANPQDFILKEGSLLTKVLKDRIGSEFKASVGNKGIKIGQLTLNKDSRELIYADDSGEAKTTVGAIKKETGYTGDQNILELALTSGDLKSIGEGADITNFVFNNLFDKSPILKSLFYNKASSITFTQTYASKITYLTVDFPTKEFNSNNFKATVGRDKSIVLFVNDKFQAEIIDKYNKSIIQEYRDSDFKETVTLSTGKKIDIIALPYNSTYTLGAEIENSIRTKPASGGIRVKVTTAKQQKKATTLSVISDAQLTALVQREVEKRMPKGPLRGPPLNPIVLTYRTGKFVESIKVIQDFRQSLMTYYYAPNYRVHEKRGARAPRLLLQSSIRETVKSVYSQKFRILRGF